MRPELTLARVWRNSSPELPATVLAIAHLKNFGIVYDDVRAEGRLAPVYDIVTTSVYLSKDNMALTLNGSNQWPTAKELRRLGGTRSGIAPGSGEPNAKEYARFAEVLAEWRGGEMRHFALELL